MKDKINGQHYRRTKSMPCIFCGNTSPSKIIDVSYGMQVSIAHCPNCNFEYQSPQPSYKATEAYRNWRWDHGEDMVIVSPWWQLKNAGDHLDLIKPFINTEMNILDFGAGSGAFVAVAMEKGLNIVGYDRSEGARKAALKLHNIELEGVLTPGPFDCITLWDRVEKFKNPEKSLMNIRKHLKAPGRIFIEASNLNYCDGDQWGLYCFDRQFYYTPYSLEDMVSSLGFTNYEVLSDDRMFVATCEWRG